MKVIRTSVFERALRKLGATESQLRGLEEEIAGNPTAGDVIQGLSGARKIRFRLGSEGKRGGGRAIYVAIVTVDTAYLLTAYSKATKDDLSEADKKLLKLLIQEIEREEAKK